MFIKQFKAGYLLDCIGAKISFEKLKLDRDNPDDKRILNQIDGLLKHVSSFDVNFPFEYKPDFKNIPPILAVVNNIITRGLPTKAPVLIEETFNQVGLTEKSGNRYEIEYSYKSVIDFNDVFELLHIIEPGLLINRGNYGGKIESNGEWNFLDQYLAPYPYAKQILQTQRDFSTIAADMAGGRRVDFSFEYPYLNNEQNGTEKRGVIIEYDGNHHRQSTYRYYDKYRNDAAEEEDYQTLRQPYDLKLTNNLQALFNEEIFRIFERNFHKDITADWKIYSIIFIPLAIARVQKTLIECFIAQPQLWEQKTVKLAVIERDFPCSALAIESLNSLFYNLTALVKDKGSISYPKLKLTIFGAGRINLNDNFNLQQTIKPESEFNADMFDVVIDHAILKRSNIYQESEFLCDQAITIRSSHYYDTTYGKERRMYCSELLKYKTIAKRESNGSYVDDERYIKHIEFFLQNIFRKTQFREGQIPIISRALQNNPVIGLLPTGAGKSITYQLPAFLQPGLTLVVDPIKSLMEDQVRVLKQNLIDSIDYINSNLDRETKTKKLIDFRYGETLLLFLSPERFVMKDFRNIVKNINYSPFGLAFSYCVIDEVHCVSEWGHDFRFTYLMLGKNSQSFCKTRTQKPVSLIGLTATASFDVLADIERELQIQNYDVSNAIVMIENTIRPELFFRVIDVNGKERIDELNNDFNHMGENIQKLNNKELIQKSLQHHIDNFDTQDVKANDLLISDCNGEPIQLSQKEPDDFYSIVFCPVKGQEGNPIGVDFVYNNLSTQSKGYYYSSNNDEDIGAGVQKHFEDFTANRLHHMVCTKAFGMGIDKKDIRTTYHYVYSGSLESLVQEAGRAGRDRKVAEAAILFSKESYVAFDVYGFFRDHKNDPSIQNRYTRRAIRENFEQRWDNENNRFVRITFPSIEDIISCINNTNFTLINAKGAVFYQPAQETIIRLREMMLIKERRKHKYIIERYSDRGIHDFFHSKSYKGLDTEKAQIRNLFEVKEFTLGNNNEFIYLENQSTLQEKLDRDEEEFSFIITKEKKYPNASNTICSLLGIENPQGVPPFVKTSYIDLCDRALRYSNDFNDFLFILEEKKVITNLNKLEQITKDRLHFVYCRDREDADTGRLVYRMHCMGLLEDYLIDYQLNNLYRCTLKKKDNIKYYLNHIKMYLERYLSEKSAADRLNRLKVRVQNITGIADQIKECLYFLSEFSIEQIADKRKRATDEVERMLLSSVAEKDWYEQNISIKEQIFYYFNAKYARDVFEIDGEPYSLLNDYYGKMGQEELLEKYVQALKLEGTEQNNYRHMIGSCRKIMRALVSEDFENDWVLRLLKALSMYSANKDSYVSEANEDLERGIENLYKDLENELELIEPIFNKYFNMLEKNIEFSNNKTKQQVELIRTKLLLKLQTLHIDHLINANAQILTKYA